MIELPSLVDAWVFLSIPHGRGSVPLALRTGPCLVVGQLPEISALPSAIFRARPGAFAAGFPIESILFRSGGWAVGLLLDPRALFTDAELDMSLESLGTSKASSRDAHGRSHE
jgi:hypothetical protein